MKTIDYCIVTCVCLVSVFLFVGAWHVRIFFSTSHMSNMSPADLNNMYFLWFLTINKKKLWQGKWEFVAEHPFDSTIKRMSTVYRNKETSKNFLFLKGAPERVLNLCTKIIREDGNVDDLDNKKMQNIRYHLASFFFFRCWHDVFTIREQKKY